MLLNALVTALIILKTATKRIHILFKYQVILRIIPSNNPNRATFLGFPYTRRYPISIGMRFFQLLPFRVHFDLFGKDTLSFIETLRPLENY